jgi:16S rRNA (cytidine1402-2'-O)-methyltransferase
LYPIDPVDIQCIHENAIKAAGHLAVALEPVACGENETPLFACGNAGSSSAECLARTQADFDENGRRSILADQIDLAAPDTEISLDDLKSLSDQEITGHGFGLRATFKVGGLLRDHCAARMLDMENALYVVATPIGNLGDISLRALDVLRTADIVACEDTRHARHLLDHHGIRVQTVALHQHNENAAADKLIRLLADGKRVALISDAGTPGVSDPGARTVAAVRAAGCKVIPLPGACAAIAALSAAGLADPNFLFVGFLPTKVGARRTAIQALAPTRAALVFYEAPHRVMETVADLVELLEPQRDIVIARELTKLFEQIERMPLGEAPAWLAADPNRQRGEFVLVVNSPPARDPAALDPASERVLTILLAELPLKQAAKLAAEITGQPRNALYAQALVLKKAEA